MNIEERANQLESELKSGQFSKVSDDLYRESVQNPGEFNALVKKFGEKNAEDRKQNLLLPALEIHEEGNDIQKFFGMGKVDEVEIKTSLLTRHNEPAGEVYVSPERLQARQGRADSMQSSPSSDSPLVQRPIDSAQPIMPAQLEPQAQNVDVDNLFHVGGNIFSSVFDGFQHGNSSKIRKDNGGSSEVHMYQGKPLPRAGFGNW